MESKEWTRTGIWTGWGEERFESTMGYQSEQHMRPMGEDRRAMPRTDYLQPR